MIKEFGKDIKQNDLKVFIMKMLNLQEKIIVNQIFFTPKLLSIIFFTAS